MPPSGLVPEGHEVYLDHVGLFVPDFDASPRRLEELGFSLTPFVAHLASTQPGVAATPSGTGNQCAIFGQGYLEMLGPTVDTPLSRQLRAQLDRYPGWHLIAFAANHPEENHERIGRDGFKPLPLVRLARPVPADTGEETCRFSVIRVPPEVMPEGRIQIVTHHTPELVWQPRYQHQPNGAAALTGVLACVNDPREAAERFSRFVGVEPVEKTGTREMGLHEGRVVFIQARRFGELYPDRELPCTPYIAEVSLRTDDLAATRRYFDDGGIRYETVGDDALRVAGAEALGASFLFHQSPEGGIL